MNEGMDFKPNIIEDNAKIICKKCEEDEKEENLKKELVYLVTGSLVYAGALILKLPFLWELSLFLLSYTIIGWDIVWKAIRNIFRGEIFDENFLMTLATLGAFAIKQFPEAVAVMLFFKVGELFQDMALDHSRRSIKSLVEIRSDYANLKVGNDIKRVDPEVVNVGDIIIVNPGEKIPLDGVVIDGLSMLDTSALTGESIPRRIKPGDEILSGMINKTGLLTIRVTKRFKESTVSKILNLVENAADKKAPTEKFITKFAKYYTPVVVLCAFLLATVPVLLYNIPSLTPLFVHEETFSEWIYKALIFLVISCPCALVISIPLGFFGGLGASSRRGILVKGSNYLEGLNNLHTIVWDKTGTLTRGVFRVVEVVTKNNFSKDEILKFAAQAESHSNHPIAQSIREAINERVDIEKVEGYEEIPGYGIKAYVDGHRILVGNDKILHRENIEHVTCNVEGTVIHVVIDNKYAGYILISDEIKEDAKSTIQKLKELGIKRQIMFTGDNEKIARSISQKLGIDKYYAELLPQQKVEKMEELMENKVNKKELIAFVGDGINDAPVLMRSDIGIAMGAMGSDAAIEAADIVLMTDEPSKVYESIKIARKTKSIVWQNIILALGVKVSFLVIGALGVATMWEAVFADVGVALLAILNALRILRIKNL